MEPVAFVLVTLLFANDRYETVIDIEMQDFASQETCEAAGTNLVSSTAPIQWKCEPK